MGTCVMVVRGAAGRITGTAVVGMGICVMVVRGAAAVAMGIVVVATGAATGTAFFFFLDRKGTAPAQIERQQQMPNASRNQAHQGQPPPSVVVVVAMLQTRAPEAGG